MQRATDDTVTTDDAAFVASAVDVAVISGDSTDHALDVHSPAVERLARNVRRLADHCPVLMLQGTFSHEPPGTLSIFRLLGGRFSVYVADRIGQVALLEDRTWLESAGWRFEALPSNALGLFTCVPLRKRRPRSGKSSPLSWPASLLCIRRRAPP